MAVYRRRLPAHTSRLPQRLNHESLEVRQLLAADLPEVAFNVSEQWNTGFTASLTITNDEARTFQDWQLEFDMPAKITSLWNATLVSHVGNHYVVRHPSWDADLAPGEVVTIGFVADGTPASPSNYVFPGAGTTPNELPAITISDASVVEGNVGPTNASFSVRLSKPSAETVTVAYATAAGTATANQDYQSTSGTLTFAAGQTERLINVAVSGDTQAEANETFRVLLSSPQKATLADAEAIGTIVNDDGTPPATSAPAKPIIALSDAFPNDGRLTLSFNIWQGVNAKSWQLLENGQVVGSGNLTSNTPAAQTASIELSDRFYGAYRYQFVATNEAGSTSSDVLNHVTGGASRILIAMADSASQALQLTVSQGATEFDVSLLDQTAGQFEVASNNHSVASVAMVDGDTVRVTGVEAGRAALRIRNVLTGEERYVGIRVRTATGELPGLPDYVAMGSVGEDSQADLNFWRDFGDGTDGTNKRMDVRYIYLNGGPENGWRTWQDGQRAQSYVRESLKMGMVPYFVWYNIPDGGESYETNKQHIESPAYLEGYFSDLKFALDTVAELAPDEPVGFVLEPDFLGYLMQIGRTPASQVAARTDAAYTSGVLNAASDPQFANNVQGLVSAINYTISKYAPNAQFGWQFNLWASPGIHTPIPGVGLMHLTDTMGIEAGRAAIAAEAREIAHYYIEAGILTHGASFVSIDKYGLDALGYEGNANDPAGSRWFWNNDHWSNYLLFSRTLHEETNLPVTLWQMPVGHINGSQAENPYDPSGKFADLSNTPLHYEDSAGTFFLGDSFTASGARFDYFSSNASGDPKVTVSGNTITWGSHIEEARDAGITQILFGAGVGISTDGVGSPPTDGYWWITRVQDYYEDPVPLGETSEPWLSIDDVTVTEGNSGTAPAQVRVRLSNPSATTVSVQYATANGSAMAGSDYQAATGTITFQPGETSKFIAVPIVGDTAIEAGESFLVRITGASGARLADTEAIVTIADNDAPVLPSIVVDNVAVVEGPGGTNARFVVRLSAPVSQAVQINYQTRDGSAQAGLDYAAANGVLTFAPGETSKTVDVAVLDDVLVESNEGFFLDLRLAGTGSVAAIGAATITDNDAPTAPGVSTQLRILEDWGGGFTAEVTITNNGTTTLTDWRLAFAFGGTVSSSWNGTIASHTGDQYVLRPAAWNGTIPPGGSVGFVFQRSTAGSLPTGVAVT